MWPTPGRAPDQFNHLSPEGSFSSFWTVCGATWQRCCVAWCLFMLENKQRSPKHHRLMRDLVMSSGSEWVTMGLKISTLLGAIWWAQGGCAALQRGPTPHYYWPTAKLVMLDISAVIVMFSTASSDSVVYTSSPQQRELITTQHIVIFLLICPIVCICTQNGTNKYSIII